MKVTINSSIVKKIDTNIFRNTEEIQGSLVGSDKDTNSFTIKETYKTDIDVSGAIDIVDVFGTLGIDNLSKITMIYIQVQDKDVQLDGQNDVRFSLTYGGVFLGNMSKFEIINVDSIISDLTLSLTAPISTRNINLTIFVGTK